MRTTNNNSVMTLASGIVGCLIAFIVLFYAGLEPALAAATQLISAFVFVGESTNILASLVGIVASAFISFAIVASCAYFFACCRQGYLLARPEREKN